MKKPFQVGDRVKVYCKGERVGAEDFAETIVPWRGTVRGFDGDMLIINPDLAMKVVRCAAHVKACRRPVKRERRRVRLHQHMDGGWQEWDTFHANPQQSESCMACTTFIEARRGK